VTSRKAPRALDGWVYQTSMPAVCLVIAASSVNDRPPSSRPYQSFLDGQLSYTPTAKAILSISRFVPLLKSCFFPSISRLCEIIISL